MSHVNILAAFCVGVGLGHLAAAIAILARYAIPRSPGYFHVILVPPMIISAVSIVGVGISILVDDQSLIDRSGLRLSVVYVISEFVVWWGLVSYSVFFHFRGRYRRSGR